METHWHFLFLLGLAVVFVSVIITFTVLRRRPSLDSFVCIKVLNSVRWMDQRAVRKTAESEIGKRIRRVSVEEILSRLITDGFVENKTVVMEDGRAIRFYRLTPAGLALKIGKSYVGKAA